MSTAFPWILGGGAAATAIYFWRRGRKPRPTADAFHDALTSPAPVVATPRPPEPLPGRWVWPIGVWHQRKPAISDGFHGLRREPGTDISLEHGGVDIMYRRQPGDPWPAGTPNGTPNWVMPDQRAALAASDGVVWSVAWTPRGWSVLIDHAPRKLATYYTHLSSALVTAKQTVSAGTRIGIIDADPLDGQHIKHLHFEIWHGGEVDRFDPQRIMEATWEYLPDPGDMSRVHVVRNGGHHAPHNAGLTVPVTARRRRPPRR